MKGRARLQSHTRESGVSARSSPHNTALALVKVKNEVRFELRVVATTVSAGR